MLGTFSRVQCIRNAFERLQGHVDALLFLSPLSLSIGYYSELGFENIPASPSESRYFVNLWYRVYFLAVLAVCLFVVNT